MKHARIRVYYRQDVPEAAKLPISLMTHRAVYTCILYI